MPLKLNQKALEFAQMLIKQGRVDTQGSWSSLQPNAQQEDQFLSKKSFDDYGKWFLGENTDAKPDTKERYEFPIGDFTKIVRSGLIAAEQRAGQYHHEEIKAAARKLLDMIG